METMPYNSEWTLFLDRDGVINRRIMNGYVLSYDQFEFLPGVLIALAILSEVFPRILVVTNQRGIGRRLMTVSALEGIHNRMQQEISAAGGRIDGIYVCPHDIEASCTCRKPKPGLAEQAAACFPEIVFRKSVMVGDTLSDIEFGKALCMQTVLAGSCNIDQGASVLPDYRYPDLLAFASALSGFSR